MPSLGETVRDTVGITGYREGREMAKGMSWQYPRAGEVLSGTMTGAMQVVSPNFERSLMHPETVTSERRMFAKVLADIGLNIGVVTALFSGQVELAEAAVAGKVIYNGAVSAIHQRRSSGATSTVR